ncbi:transcription factor [Stylosanthes scabra]|uniref:Transcription factor n=1 Tax=Stylosanthes scabra TaxID=79078 RepID=A0ABU6WG35_9FABA|nr:transcription factor [Stylosanthes scabra]
MVVLPHGLQQYQQEEHEHGRLQRMVAWNNAVADAGSSGHGSGFIFNSSTAAAVPSPVMFGHGQFFSQRGPFQSSNTPSFHAWVDPSSIPTTAVSMNHHHYLSPAAIHQASIGFVDSSSGNFFGFRMPARIQGFEIELASERIADMDSQLQERIQDEFGLQML